MPYLFCEEHGREQEIRAIGEQESYRRLGETLLIVSAPVKSPSRRCHTCHARMRRGQTAYLVTAYPRHLADELATYDYRRERDYLVIERAQARHYGAEPPGGIPALAAMLVS